MIGPLLVADAERVDAVPTLSLGRAAKVTDCSAGEASSVASAVAEAKLDEPDCVALTTIGFVSKAVRVASTSLALPDTSV